MTKITVGEATIRLLGKYGIDTVFGIPGVHTLDLCRGLGTGAAVRHIQTRNEMGAGLMADGYARSTGRVGAALTISGPGVTNAATALGQAYGDSIPVLLISADAASNSLGKGWGALHEVTDLNAVTRLLTAFSACARRAEDVPELMGQAFGVFRSERPRPVHISIPLDVLAETVEEDSFSVVVPPARPRFDPEAVRKAADLLRAAERPIIAVGGGAVDAADAITRLAEELGAMVVTSCAGKGIVPDDHPLSLGGGTVRPEVRNVIANCDVMLAIGTELSETDSFVDRMDLPNRLIRVDIDRRKMNDLYPAEIPILSDARCAANAILSQLPEGGPVSGGAETVARTRLAVGSNLMASEEQHARLLARLRAELPDDAVVFGDACQLAYTGAFLYPARRPRTWHYAAGYCTLGPALPGAIGAKLAQPEKPVVALAGDGGVMFTIQELVTAAELNLPIPIIVWANGGLKQIQDDMRAGNVPRVGVDGINPDFSTLARAMHCHAAEPESLDAFADCLNEAFRSDRPTLILVTENSEWLK